MCLEFSKVNNEIINFIYKRYSRAIPFIGRLIVGNDKPYKYLVKSIDEFYDQEQLVELMRKAGFQILNSEIFQMDFSNTLWLENLDV